MTPWELPRREHCCHCCSMSSISISRHFVEVCNVRSWSVGAAAGPRGRLPGPRRAEGVRGVRRSGLRWATGFVGSLGFRPARVWAGLAVGGEVAAGFLFLLGLLTPLAGLLVVATMVVAIAKVHGPKGFFVQNGGYEYNLVLIVAALAVAAMGPGRYSLDHLLGLTR